MDQRGFIKHEVDPSTGEQAPVSDENMEATDFQAGAHGELEGRDDLSGGGAVIDAEALPKAGSWAKAETAAPKKAAPAAKAPAGDK